MEDALRERVKQLVAKVTDGDGRVDLTQLLLGGSMGEIDPHSLQATFARYYHTYQQEYEKGSINYPIYAQVQQIEDRVLLRLSNLCFPYEFAEYMFYSVYEGQECSSENPMACLPLEAVAGMAWTIQTSFWAASAFGVLLLGSLTGFVLTGRKFRPRVLTCIRLPFAILLDLLGLISLFIPHVGMAIDMVWAPVAGLLATLLFASPKVGILVFLKEVMIVTDIFPLCTVLLLGRALV